MKSNTMGRIAAMMLGVVALSGAALADVTEVTAVSTTLIGGQTTRCNVKLTAPAAGDQAVTLSSDTVKVVVPGSVTVLNGKRNAAFNARTQTVLSQSSGTITASHGANSQTVTLTLEVGGLTDGVVDPEVSSGGTGSGYVFLSGNAGVGGVTVDLTSKNAAVLAVDPTCTVPEGSTDSNTFTLTASVVAADTLVNIRAKYGNSIRVFPVNVRIENPQLTINVKTSGGSNRNNAVVTVTYSDASVEVANTGGASTGNAVFLNEVPGPATYTVDPPGATGPFGPFAIVVDAYDPTLVNYQEP